MTSVSPKDSDSSSNLHLHLKEQPEQVSGKMEGRSFAKISGLSGWERLSSLFNIIKLVIFTGFLIFSSQEQRKEMGEQWQEFYTGNRVKKLDDSASVTDLSNRVDEAVTEREPDAGASLVVDVPSEPIEAPQAGASTVQDTQLRDRELEAIEREREALRLASYEKMRTAIINAKVPEVPESEHFNLLTENALHEITPGVFLGGNYQPAVFYRYSEEQVEKGEAVEFGQIINVTLRRQEGNYFDPKAPSFTFPSGTEPRRRPDVSIESLRAEEQRYLHEAIRLIDNTKVKNVLIRCQQGIDRSATVVIAYLMSKYHVTADQALNFVRSKRFIANPLDEAGAGVGYMTFLRNEFRPIKLD